MSEHAVFKLDASRAPEAATLLTRAFFNSPVWTWVVPDEAQRRTVLPLGMRASVAGGLIRDSAYGIGKPLRGVAIWAPPAVVDVDPDGTRTGWGAVLSAVGDDGRRRFDILDEVLRPHHNNCIAAEGWYLSLLGVEPAAQRTGVGTALLRAMWTRLDASNAATYTDTENETNIAYYEKQGFDLVQQGVLPGNGPQFFCFLHTPGVMH
jgi:ribosomal protein S18 acetylase RimI-like enzyme